MSPSVVFSPCGFYRFFLKRELSDSKKEIIFVGLNPSMATKDYEDNTLRRLKSYCYNWGYGTLHVVNLFARIGRNPAELKRQLDPIGKENNHYLDNIICKWSENKLCDLWLGWGVKGHLMNRDVEVVKMLRPYLKKRVDSFVDVNGPMAIGITKDGSPRHPLYVAKFEELKPIDLSVNFI